MFFSTIPHKLINYYVELNKHIIGNFKVILFIGNCKALTDAHTDKQAQIDLQLTFRASYVVIFPEFTLFL